MKTCLTLALICFRIIVGHSSLEPVDWYGVFVTANPDFNKKIYGVSSYKHSSIFLKLVQDLSAIVLNYTAKNLLAP